MSFLSLALILYPLGLFLFFFLFFFSFLHLLLSLFRLVLVVRSPLLSLHVTISAVQEKRNQHPTRNWIERQFVWIEDSFSFSLPDVQWMRLHSLGRGREKERAEKTTDRQDRLAKLKDELFP